MAILLITLPKLLQRRLPWLILLLLPLGGAGGWLVWSRAQEVARTNTLVQQAVAVTRQDVTTTVSASGSMTPLASVNISPKQAGRLVALYVEQGDRVQVGQILARMDDSNLRGQLLEAQGKLQAAQASLKKTLAGNRPQEIQEAEANLRNAQATLLASRSSYDSNLKLVETGAISRNDFNSARSQYEADLAKVGAYQQQLNLSKAGSRAEDIESARAQVVQAQGSLETIQTQLNDTVIRAPLAGLVTQKYANPGAFVTPTTSASTTSSATSSSVLAVASDLEALVNVAESDIRQIRVGQQVELQVDAYPGRSFKGKVRLVAPESVVAQNVTSFEVRIQVLDDRQQQLKSGMNLTARFRVSRAQAALVIPSAAIVSEGGDTRVYVLGAQGQSQLRPIQVGTTLGSQTQVLSGLQAGEQVLLAPPGQRQPNAKPVNATGPLGGGPQARPIDRP